jgi:hypothetical protein
MERSDQNRKAAPRSGITPSVSGAAGSFLPARVCWCGPRATRKGGVWPCRAAEPRVGAEKERERGAARAQHGRPPPLRSHRGERCLRPWESQHGGGDDERTRRAVRRVLQAGRHRHGDRLHRLPAAAGAGRPGQAGAPPTCRARLPATWGPAPTSTIRCSPLIAGNPVSLS